MSDKILVFIPTYNCESQIPRVIRQFDKGTLQKLFTEILVIDNCSQDKTFESARNALNNLSEIKINLIQNKENISLGGSHKVAFDYAIKHEFDYVIVLHGDDQGSISDIAPYIRDSSYKKYDSFLGSRFSWRSKLVGYSKFRIFGNICNQYCVFICD